MSYKKITDLDALAFLSGDDLLLVVNDPAGSPATHKITVQNFLTNGLALGYGDWDSFWADAIHSHQSDVEGSKLDHGLALIGLGDDDHPQYAQEANNLSDLTDKPVAFGNIKQAASETVTGVVELATNAEALTGTDTQRAITPANLKNTLQNSTDVDHFVDRGDPAADDLTQAGMTTDGAWHDWDLSAIVPEGTTAVLIRVAIMDDATACLLEFRKNGNTNTYNAGAIQTQVNTVWVYGEMIVACDANRVVEYRVTSATISGITLIVRGWWI